MRCRACNRKLDDADLRRKAKDWDICSDCRFHGSQEWNLSDKQYVHGEATGVQLDGSPLRIEEYYESDYLPD